MGILLLIGAGLAAFAGISMLGTAKNAIHEIEAGMCFLTAAVCFAGCAIVNALGRIERLMEARRHREAMQPVEEE